MSNAVSEPSAKLFSDSGFCATGFGARELVLRKFAAINAPGAARGHSSRRDWPHRNPRTPNPMCPAIRARLARRADCPAAVS
jgi:hypothetical protein